MPDGVRCALVGRWSLQQLACVAVSDPSSLHGVYVCTVVWLGLRACEAQQLVSATD